MSIDDRPAAMTSEEKRQLLSRLLGQSSAPRVTNLTPEQRRLWFLRQLDDAVPWHVHAAARMRGPLDLAAMQQAIAALVQRHEVLRTVADDVNGQPLRSTLPAVALRLDLVELDHEPVDGAIVQEVSRPFDVRLGPLVRATAVRSGTGDHVVVLTAHRLVADQLSVDLLLDELFRRYGALTGHGAVEGAGGSMPFDAYAQLLRDWLDGDEARGQLAAWTQWLDGVPSLHIASDRVRPLTKTFAAVSRAHVLAPGTWDGVQRLAERVGVPPDAVLLAAFALLLHRASGQWDFAVGVSNPGRDGADVALTIGPLENLLALRCRVPDGASFAGWVERVAGDLHRARSLSRVPFDLVVEAVDPPRELSQTPLFQVAFAFGEGAAPVPAPAGTEVRRLAVDSGFVAYDLELLARRLESGLALVLTGNADLFDAPLLEVLLDRYHVLLAAALDAPETALHALPLMTWAERDRAVLAWNQTSADHPHDRCLHELVARQAAACPDALAIRCGDRELTYRQLCDRARQVARELRALGVGPESLVAVVADRSADSVVAMLGVLHAGAAYVPVAADAPAGRLRFVLDDAGVAAAVEGGAVTGTIAAVKPGLPVVAVAQADVAAADDQGPLPAARPANLAYVIYTSGSTGHPKGVAVEHRSIVASTAARWAFEDPGTDLLTLPLTFDAAAGGLYWALTRGGSVVLLTDDEARDPRLLAAVVRRQPITHVNSMHAHYKLVLDATAPEDLAALRYVDVGGEALPPQLVAEHYRRTPEAKLYNCYGPTETTVWATTYECLPADAGARSIPIGRPVNGTHIYLLDQHLAVVPPGIPGELFIGGEGVARGYLGRPALTAERFVPDPFAGAGARLYRTGDRARYRPDGTVEFLGRTDDQVKIRGFRVELGEVEIAVAADPEVAAAAVVLHDDGLTRRLVAYVSPVDGAQLEADRLRVRVAATVPDYMVPGTFVVLERLPVTSSGKVDRRSLPAPASLAGGQHKVRPRTAAEDVVAMIFSELLGVAEVDVTSDFFDLGGDSLLLARMMNQISRRYDVRVPLDQIFRVPTVAGIAYAIENQQQVRDDADAEAMFAAQLQGLRADLDLDPAIRPDGLPHADWLNPREVLVTGATGFIGAYVARELLERTDATVHCLVRAEDDAAAAARLEERMRAFLAWDDRFRDRVRAVRGDLGLPRLGLTEERFDQLAASLDAIYHSGAVVNFVYSYEVLRAPNVGGTVELLRMPTRRRLKALHHVSTMDVWIGTHAPRPFLEQELPEPPRLIPTTYARSKWVAEKLVSRAASRGIPVCVYRPWLAVGHRQTGVAHTTDYLVVALKGFMELGILPTHNDIVNAITVDFLAESIVHVSLQPEAYRRIYFHIGNLNPAPMLRIYEWLRTFGYDLPLIDYEEARRLAQQVSPDNALFTLAPIIGPATTAVRQALRIETHEAIDARLEYQNLTAVTAGSGITCPPVDERYVHTTLRYLIDCGYLPPPASRVGAS